MTNTLYSRAKDRQLVESRLVGGETVLAVSRIHWGIVWKPIALFFIGLLFGVLFAWELAAVIITFSLIFTATNLARAYVLLAVVTNKRMMARYGLLMVDVVDIHFDKLESLELEQMLPGYFLGYSNLVVMGTGNRQVTIPYIANGQEIRKAYSEAVLNKDN